MSGFSIRSATAADADVCREIYRPYVEDTPLTFETELPSTPEMATRIGNAVETHAWLVLEGDGQVIGYAAAKPWDPRDAYRWSCETGIYLDPRHRGRGRGRALYGALLDCLHLGGYRVAVGRVVIPNDASVKLHESLGFEHSGTLRAIGWKLGAWHDVAHMQKLLGGLGAPSEAVGPGPHQS